MTKKISKSSPSGKRRTPWMALLMATHKELKANTPKTSFKTSMKKASTMKAAFDRKFGGKTPSATELTSFVATHI